MVTPFCALAHSASHTFHAELSEYWYRLLPDALEMDLIELTPSGNNPAHLTQEHSRPPGMAKRYVGLGLSLLEHLSSRLFEFAKMWIQILDSASNRFPSFGWHVLARKHAS